MTQRQLAYALRVSVQAVSKWERSESYPDLTLLVPIAELFDVTLDELFGRK
ncbi:MAG: helix-turn-helix transcriptional regulator [Clostridia bacterium]|nr:helix-turn-helix transcriptional regulator [Clostridia bacterium]